MEIKPVVKPDYVVLTEESTLAELIGKMKQNEKHAALIFRNGKYLGTIEKKRLLRSKIDPSEIKLKKFVHRTPVLNEHADVVEAAYTLFKSDAAIAPVESNKQIIGVVDGLDLMRVALAIPEIKKLTIADVKLVKPSKILKDDQIARAMDVMHEERVDHLPVYDGGKMYGVISYKDILRRYLNWTPKRDFSVRFNKLASSKGAEPNMPSIESLPVGTFSTNDNLVTAKKDTPLSVAIAQMLQANVHDLFVMAQGEFVGLLTVQNLLRSVGSLKIPKNFNIQFIGLNQVDLEPYQKYNVQKIASNEAMKLQRKIKNEFTLVLHLKEYAKPGKQEKQHKYSVHLRIEYPGKIVTVSQDDWDLETALRMTFANAQNAVGNKFRKPEKVKHRE